jgi:hypothetical protein
MTQNDKIVELIKSALSEEVMQYRGCGAAWENSELQTKEGFIALCDRIIKYPDKYRVKPKTKKIVVRNWLCTSGAAFAWYQPSGATQEQMEQLAWFKQWLDAEPRVYEVEV